MTKRRAPLSMDTALARIAGQVPGGWATMAAEVDRSERHVRKWGDESAREEINFTQARKLDLLYRRHGGHGFPIFDAYGQLLELDIADRFFDQFEVLRRATRLVKEAGEAEAAVLRVALPGATAAHRAEALRELLEAIEAAKLMLPLLEGPAQLPEANERGPPGAS